MGERYLPESNLRLNPGSITIQLYLDMVPPVIKAQFPHFQSIYEYYIHFREKWRLHEREIMFIL